MNPSPFTKVKSDYARILRRLTRLELQVSSIDAILRRREEENPSPPMNPTLDQLSTALCAAEALAAAQPLLSFPRQEAYAARDHLLAIRGYLTVREPFMHPPQPSNSPVPGKPWLAASSTTAINGSPERPTYLGLAIVSCAPELLDHPALREQEGLALLLDRTDPQGYGKALWQRQFAQIADNALPRFPDGLYELGSPQELERFLELHPPRTRVPGTPWHTTRPSPAASGEQPPMSDNAPGLSAPGHPAASPASPATD